MKQSIKKILCSILIPCLMILCLLPPSSSLAAGQFRYVYTENGKSLNVRDLPGKNGTVIARLANGSKVSVLDEEGDWVGIDYNGRTGYVMARFLTEGRPASPEIEWTETSKVLYVETGNTGRLHLRKDASKSTASLGLFANGTRVQVSAVSASWAKVSVFGKTGYMLLSCLTDQKPKSSAAANSATRFVKNGLTLRMYSEAGADSLVLMKLPGGTQVRVYSEDGKWSRVTAHGQVGYVLTASLTDDVPRAGMTKARVINPNGASYVNLRSSPGITGEDTVLAHIKVNTTVEILGRKKSWIMVSCKGKVGYMHRSFLSNE